MSTPESSDVAPIVFDRVVIQSFRGFSRRIELDLGASVVIVHGPNGFGKTSLFDALQWVLLGDVSRLRESRMHRTDEHIVNAYRAGERATVQAMVRLGGRPVTLTRVGNRSGSTLTWSTDGHEARGDDAERLLASEFGGGQLDLPTTLKACGLLQQDVAREVLSSKPSERFETYSNLLGLGELGDFERWAKSSSDRATTAYREFDTAASKAESDLAQATARLLEIRQTPSARSAVNDLVNRVESLLRSAEMRLEPGPIDRNSAARLLASSSTLAREAASALQEIRQQLASSEPAAVGEAVLSQLSTDVEEAEVHSQDAAQAVQGASESLSVLRSQQASLTQMASAVLVHIDGDHCPACGQTVVEAELRARLASIEGSVVTATAEKALTAAERVAREAARSLSNARDALGDARRAEVDHRRWESELKAAADRAGAVLSSVPSWWTAQPTAPSVDELPTLLDAVASTATQLAAVSRELIAAIDASTTADEAIAQSDAVNAQGRVAEARQQREAAAHRRNAAAALHQAVRDARLELVKREFARLGPLAQDIYSRLDPHPTFQDIDLVSDVFRAVGTTVPQVRDSAANVDADPSLVFSSAQTNIVAISYLMALNLASSIEGAKVILMDDPLQAMDDVNVLGFADLCRHVRRQRQVFVSTHERRFATLLQRKLAPRHPGDRTIDIEFVGWDRSGPWIKHRDLSDQTTARHIAAAE